MFHVVSGSKRAVSTLGMLCRFANGDREGLRNLLY